MEESTVKIIVKGNEYVVPLTSRVEILLKKLISSGVSGSGEITVPDGYTVASDDDIDNLFP